MSKGSTEVFKVTIRAPIERVFHELTRTDALQACFFNSWLVTPGQVEAGAPVQWQTPSRKNVAVLGVVLAYEPPRRFAHSFKFSRYDDAPFDIAYELNEARGGTEVTMTLTGVVAGTRSAKDATGGCRFILATLKEVAENGRMGAGKRLLFGAFGAFESLLMPARCRTEHWPLQ